MKKCEGINYKGNNCNRNVKGNNKYCNGHQYFENFTEDNIKQIQDKSCEIITCKRCNKWKHKEEFFNKDTGQQVVKCNLCREQDARQQLKRKNKKVRCKWFDRQKNNCIFAVINNTDYCKHHQYIKNYTDEMKKNSKICSGCTNYKYCGNYNTCEQ